MRGKLFGVLFDKELLTLQVLFCQVYRHKEAVLLRIEGKNKGMYSLILFLSRLVGILLLLLVRGSFS